MHILLSPFPTAQAAGWALGARRHRREEPPAWWCWGVFTFLEAGDRSPPGLGQALTARLHVDDLFPYPLHLQLSSRPSLLASTFASDRCPCSVTLKNMYGGILYVYFKSQPKDLDLLLKVDESLSGDSGPVVLRADTEACEALCELWSCVAVSKVVLLPPAPQVRENEEGKLWAQSPCFYPQ